MLENNLKETAKMSLASIWNFGEAYSKRIVASEVKKCFINEFNKAFADVVGVRKDVFVEFIDGCRDKIQLRGEIEIEYWMNERNVIEAYSKEQAIGELIAAKKIDEKINQINSYVGGIFA
jgi:hypothetical protein